jgi:hypothetical protein
MTVDQKKALLSIDEMLSKLLGGLNNLGDQADRSQRPDDTFAARFAAGSG